MAYTQFVRMRIRDRLARCRTLRALRSPRWIIKNEQLQLCLLRHSGLLLDNQRYEALLNKHVHPLMDGHGYITVPDGDVWEGVV